MRDGLLLIKKDPIAWKTSNWKLKNDALMVIRGICLSRKHAHGNYASVFHHARAVRQAGAALSCPFSRRENGQYNSIVLSSSLKEMLVRLTKHLKTSPQTFITDEFINQLTEFILAQVVVDVCVNVLELFDLCHLTLFCLVWVYTQKWSFCCVKLSPCIAFTQI